MTPFVKRKIDVTINLGEGAFGEQKGPDVTLSGHRVSLSLALMGGESQPASHMRIFGMPLDRMNQLTCIGTVQQEIRKAQVLIAAGDEGGPMSVVHMGTILTAFAEMNSAPEVAFDVTSQTGLFEAVKPVNARSYKGAADAADIMKDLAGDMGVAFENNGVSVILQNPYFPGCSLAQVQRCANAARIDYSLDRGTLAIWPRTGARKLSGDIRVAKDTGMVGYPTFSSQGIMVRTLFNPDVVLGASISVETDLTPAKGRWKVVGLAHTLESEVPNGAWFTDMYCNRDFANE